jgi:hypothetical protein
MKKTYKLVGLLSILALVLTITPVTFASYTPPGDVTTKLTRDTAGGGTAPVVKVKWEMRAPYTSLLGVDDDMTKPGAQFDAPGEYQGYKNYSICAIVTDEDSLYNADVAGVYADIYYPSDVAFHPESTTCPDVDNGGTTNVPDYGSSGCGAQRGDENELTKLSKDDGIALFCDTIRQGDDPSLPTFNVSYFAEKLGGTPTQAEMYSEICADDGELQKETAYVYCVDKSLYYEDPAGDYRVVIMAQDNSGLSGILENSFEYTPLVAYAVDFTEINYGNVKLNTKQGVSGDKTFNTSDRPTVRNLGNTRLYIGVIQDDMGLGTTDGVYNVKYDARVGNNEADWKDYWPNTASPTYLQDILDLSEDEEMDFSILVTKFPTSEQSWTGTLTLSAKQANFRECYINTCKGR